MNKKKGIKKMFYLLLITLMSLMCTIPVLAVEKKSQNFSRNYTLTGNQAQDIINIARAQNNKAKAQLGYKNPWCAAFVLDCARLSGISESIIPYNYAEGGGCGYLYRKLINDCKAKQISKSDAKPGDIVFYYCSSCKAYVHVGYYDGNGYCIEGNVGGKVLRYNTSYKDSKGHNVTSGKIQRIYLRPNYKIALNNCSVTLSKTSFTYTGKAQTPSIVVKNGSTTLKNNTHYTYKVTNNINIGVATITITGKGDYTGTKTITYKIVPKTVSGVKLSVSRKKLTVSFSKQNGASGYQIAYRKKGTSTWTTVNCTSTSQTFSLKALTNYQVRVRAYKTFSSSSKVYGGWSSISTKFTLL